jgi:hypothetical protein
VVGFPNNGLYASPSEGPVHVKGGTYANNGISNIRVKGPSSVRNTTVRCTTAPDHFQNMRGIWLRDGSCLVDECTVEIHNVTYSGGTFVVGAHGEIRNSSILVDADDVPGVNIYHNDDVSRSTAQEQGIHCQNVRIEGASAENAAVTITDRDSCSFVNCSVSQTGENRDGFFLIRSVDSRIQDTLISVSGTPIRLEESDIETINVDTTPESTET